ncbi:hypothetical protein Brms1b_004217 [Colletotrichum noveboracense]|nr:hypothetical protein Brms1b_004217 [Colletotrichum noveboracense]
MSSGSPARSRSGSQAAQRPNPFGPSMGFDPAKPEGGPEKDHKNTRIDLPAEAYTVGADRKNAGETPFAKRPGFNTAGKPCNLEVNQFRVKSWNDKATIYQYDVMISPTPMKYNVVFQKVWKHATVQAMLKKYKCLWLCDGRKLAWAPVAINRGEERLTIDLDEGFPPPKSGKPRRKDDNKFFFVIRQTKQIHLSALEAYLNNRMDWDNSVLEAMNFLDHLVRQYPTENLLSIKRNFYNEHRKKAFDLGNCIELVKGVYASVRMNQSFSGSIGRGLGLNVDVANTAFWKGNMQLHMFVRSFLETCDKRWKNQSPDDIARLLAPVRQNSKNGAVFVMSDAFKHLRKLAKLRFTPRHRGKEDWAKVYVIKAIAFGQEYGERGATANNIKFTNNGEEMTVAEYFQKTYGFKLQFPNWPLIETQKAGFFPMEVCIIKPMQRYPYKLGPDETAMMIKGAVTRPNVRKADIMEAKAQLAWKDDPYLKQYGVVFDEAMAKTQGCLLEPPKIQYANNVVSPMFAGRWDLRGKKFWVGNRQPLQSWGILILEDSTRKPAADQFVKMFKQTYTGHGGKILKDAVVIDSESRQGDMALALANGHKAIKKATGMTPQLIFCVLRFNNAGSYERIKKSADCRFGVLTQCVLARHVEKNQGQYHSNVAMKVNAKLGGITCRIPNQKLGPNSKAPAFFERVTMMIGVDVSHATPGIDAPSMATMTMSMDQDATFYAAAVDTNGYRVEMLSPVNTRNFLARLMPTWHKRMGHPAPPPHIIYFRDGVSEGQYAQVLEYEIGTLKAIFKEKYPGATLPRFTVIVATKRHHVRFFPQQGDKNGNPLPGTLLEKEVCHPFWWDFYLCSHVAIQGTARPVHYTVLVDEANMKPNDLQKMIYGQCYQYARSTTPVSLHPAIYYADLAAGRARAHENIATSQGFRSGPKAAEMVEEYGARGQSMFDGDRPTEALQLLPLGGASGDADPASTEMFRNTMWYI